MQYWLLKTEPEEWSWIDQVKSGGKGAEWNGVRNFQAAKNLKNMKKGDRCFFYHTGKIKSIVGIAEVIKEAYLDKTDKTGKFVSIAVKALYPLKREVRLKEIKKNKVFKDFSLSFFKFFTVLRTAVFKPAKDKLHPPFLKIGFGNLK